MIPTSTDGANLTQDVAGVAPGKKGHGPWLLRRSRLDRRNAGSKPDRSLSHVISTAETAQIDEMAALLRCCIDLSRGRRAALITAAVLEQLDIGAAEVAA